jgi:hypothetical protein
MKNILWPTNLHWRTRRLIKNFKVLKSSNREDIYWQKTILESEIDHIKWLEQLTNHPYYRMSSANITYKLELQYALSQLEKL